ncbi:MAG: spore germination protein, partial [Syntrophomonadaceae bacterium]|nr:spore germination protein [Syntrophomonadaceae bacterium]
MLAWIGRILRHAHRDRFRSPRHSRGEPGSVTPPEEDRTLTSSLDQNKKIIAAILDRADDLMIREFSFGGKKPRRAFLAYFEPLVNPELLHRDLLQPLLRLEQLPGEVTIQWLKEQVLPAGRVFQKKNWRDVANDITKGLTALFVEGQDSALLVYFFEDISRPIDQPTTETVVRGPADSFNEDLRTNMALLRKRLRTSRLAVERFELGEVTKTAVNLVYLKGYVDPELVQEAGARLRRIRADGVLASGQVEEFIQDNPYSPFSGIDATERPDRLASALLEGRLGLLFDNTPFALIFPTTLVAQLQSPEDYYNRYLFSSFIRLLRWVGLAFSLLLPSFYIAVTTFHQELVPTTLLFSLITSREGVPFPGFLEALIMEITFEILREAGIRLPRPFGQTISIVGAVVIGSAAVSASLVSPAMIVVVALTAIASYTVPSLSLGTAVRALRFPMMVAAAFLGLFGIMLALSVLTLHLSSLRTFGVPYLSPLAPLTLGDLKDTLVRVPVWMMV